MIYTRYGKKYYKNIVAVERRISASVLKNVFFRIELANIAITKKANDKKICSQTRHTHNFNKEFIQDHVIVIRGQGVLRTPV